MVTFIRKDGAKFTKKFSLDDVAARPWRSKGYCQFLNS